MKRYGPTKEEKVTGEGATKKTLGKAEKLIKKDIEKTKKELKKPTEDDLTLKGKKIVAAELLNDGEKIKEDLKQFAAAELPKGKTVDAVIIKKKLDSKSEQDAYIDACKLKSKKSYAACKELMEKEKELQAKGVLEGKKE